MKMPKIGSAGDNSWLRYYLILLIVYFIVLILSFSDLETVRDEVCQINQTWVYCGREWAVVLAPLLALIFAYLAFRKNVEQINELRNQNKIISRQWETEREHTLLNMYKMYNKDIYLLREIMEIFESSPFSKDSIQCGILSYDIGGDAVRRTTALINFQKKVRNEVTAAEQEIIRRISLLEVSTFYMKLDWVLMEMGRRRAAVSFVSSPFSLWDLYANNIRSFDDELVDHEWKHVKYAFDKNFDKEGVLQEFRNALRAATEGARKAQIAWMIKHNNNISSDV